MALKKPSHLDLHYLQMCVQIYLISEFTRLYPILTHITFWQTIKQGLVPVVAPGVTEDAIRSG